MSDSVEQHKDFKLIIAGFCALVFFFFVFFFGLRFS